jgi:hypothetical protein
MADAAPKKTEKRIFAYADYKSWELKKGDRFELIYGEAYAMAAPNTAHPRGPDDRIVRPFWGPWLAVKLLLQQASFNTKAYGAARARDSPAPRPLANRPISAGY